MKETISMRSRLFALLISILIAFSVVTISGEPVAAKTDSSDPVSNVFFYVKDSNDEDVLLTVMNLREDLVKEEGKAPDGKNYSCLMIDKLPTTNYCEGRGYTLEELVEKAVSEADSVKNADQLSFKGNDKIAMMTTDNPQFQESSDNYSWNELYGVKRYFFPALYEAFQDYGGNYYQQDGVCDEILKSSVEMPVYMATSSYSGRVSSLINEGTLDSGITGDMLRNSLDQKLDQENALRIVLPQTEQELRTGKATANNSRKWIFGFRLATESKSPVTAAGKVSQPTCQFQLKGTTLEITMNCTTQGAEIYHSINGNTLTATPQYSYEEPIRLENYKGVSEKLYLHAVKSGCSDAGIVSVDLPTVEQLLEQAKNEAIAQIKNYATLSAYENQQQTQVKNIITETINKIQAAQTTNQITEALQSGMKQMDAVPKTAQLISQAQAQLGKQTGVKASAAAYNKIKISWRTNSAASGYEVYRSTKKNSGYTKLADRQKNSNSYTNTGVKTGTRYYYKVRPYKRLAERTVYGDFSQPIAATAKLNKTSVTLTSAKKKVTLRWKRVAGANGYQIYRSTKKKQGYKRIKTIKRAKTTKYRSKKMKKGKRYYYKMRAYRNVGGKKVYSAYSNVKRIKVR